MNTSEIVLITGFSTGSSPASSGFQTEPFKNGTEMNQNTQEEGNY